MIQINDKIEVVWYQIEIVVPQGTHSYIYSDKIPTDESLKEKYGLFARVGNVSPLTHVVKYNQKGDMKESLEKQLHQAEYWASKNGYEQEAVYAIVEILKVLIENFEND